MKRTGNFVLIFVLGWILSVLIGVNNGYSQTYARRIVPLPTLPASCVVNSGDIVYLTLAASRGMYQCGPGGTYQPIGSSGPSQQFTIAQGSLTATAPFINHTVTWNNAGVLFNNIISDITDTASNINSRLISLRVGGAELFTVRKAGTIWIDQQNLNFSAPFISHTVTWNQAGVGFDNILSNVTDTASDASSRLINLQVGGVSRFIVRKGGNIETPGSLNMTGVAFAALGAPANGAIIYCTDCTIASPCAAAGTGSLAKRLNGAWICN